MARLGDLLDFGQLIYGLWQQLICPESPRFLGNFCKVVKINNFSREIIFGQLYRHLTIFSDHTAHQRPGYSCLNLFFFFPPKGIFSSVTRLGDFWKFLATNVLTKVGYFEDVIFQVKTSVANFWAIFYFSILSHWSFPNPEMVPTSVKMSTSMNSSHTSFQPSLTVSTVSTY